MKPDSDALRLLLERLLGTGDAWFTAAELDAALSWLSGSERHGGAALASRIGPAAEQTGRRIAVYDRLSGQIFRNGQLDLPGAHVDIDVDVETRRGRYRRLMTAFHPDRFPQHAGWLTSRSQAVLASYGRFRKGDPPEHRRPDDPPGYKPKRAARARPGRPRGRRSARLTPTAGPGPLARLRTWLLGIENLQRRVLLVLAVLCLVPVLYAYLVYKPYRDIHAPAPELADTGGRVAPATTGRDRESANKASASAESIEEPVLARNTRQEMPEILPSWHRSEYTAPSTSPDSSAGAGNIGAIDPQPEPSPESPAPERGAAQESGQPRPSPRPDPETSVSEPPAREEDLSNAPAASPPAEPPSRKPVEVADEVLSTDTDTDTDTETDTETEPPSERQAAQIPSPDSTNSARPEDVASTSVKPGESAVQSAPPEREPEREPVPEPLPDQPTLADAGSEPRADESRLARSEQGAEAAAALQQQHRENIQELLAAYRTSFEKGWLEAFLGHFTATPRENSHQGRGWFRSNYGWLFENTAKRELDIDILDMTDAGDHWIVLARFEMRVDYPDRPTTRSTRQVHYRIETNEHNQFRIAAIEY